MDDFSGFVYEIEGGNHVSCMFSAYSVVITRPISSSRGHAGHPEPVGPGHGLQRGGGAEPRLSKIRHDVLFDRFGEGYGHKGMIESARWMEQQVGQVLIELYTSGPDDLSVS